DDVGSDGGDLEVEADNHPDQGSSREDAEEDGPPRKRQKTGRAHGHRELSMDIESDDLFAPQQIDQSAYPNHLRLEHPPPVPHLLVLQAFQKLLPYDRVTSSQVLRASTRDITLASRSPSPFVHGQAYTSTSLPDVAAQYDRHVTSSPSPKPVAKPRRPDTEKILHEMYKEELVECRNQLQRYKFDKVPMTDRPALWETIKKRIVDDRVHLYLQEVVDIVQYSDRTAFPIAGGAFDKIDQEMKKLEKELIENGRSKTALPSSSQLDPNGAAKRPGIHNKKPASTLQGTSTPSERAQAASATPKSSHRMLTTPKMTHAQGETPPSVTSTSRKAMLAAQNFTRLISDVNNASPPSSPLRSLANHLNIRSDSEDSGSIYRANEEEEEQEPVSPPKRNKGKGKVKARRPIVTENGESKQQGKKSFSSSVQCTLTEHLYTKYGTVSDTIKIFSDHSDTIYQLSPLVPSTYSVDGLRLPTVDAVSTERSQGLEHGHPATRRTNLNEYHSRPLRHFGEPVSAP
ncbi:6308_t:CDS:10, partial [Acaulospora colombiana]